MNDAGFPVARVLEGIDAAAARPRPVKVNMVVKRGVNESGVLPMARHFRERGHVLRFIEYMDVGAPTAGASTRSCPPAEIVRIIDDRWPLQPLARITRARARGTGTETARARSG